jgi:hypothetical protein
METTIPERFENCKYNSAFLLKLMEFESKGECNVVCQTIEEHMVDYLILASIPIVKEVATIERYFGDCSLMATYPVIPKTIIIDRCNGLTDTFIDNIGGISYTRDPNENSDILIVKSPPKTGCYLRCISANYKRALRTAAFIHTNKPMNRIDAGTRHDHFAKTPEKMFDAVMLRKPPRYSVLYM